MPSDQTSPSLPTPDQSYQGPLSEDARTLAQALPPITPKRPPAGAPNILMILLDDVGFGASGAFGGPVHTPTAERLAGAGLSYTRFHTTALCSPTRAALLTGRNHHAVGMGHITETATPSPGYTSQRPDSATPLPEILRLNGYNTAQFGKCHEVPVWETGPTGPFDHWPAFSGFERFYGFIGGETNQWQPALVDGVTAIDPPDDPDYHLMSDLADKTIDYIRRQQALTPDKPFFAYFAPGATHAPHHVPKDWISKYRGQFDHGWDAVREATFQRQKELGVVAADALLTPRPAEIPAWDDVADEWKPILSRQMEVYAAFLEYADHHTGRVVDALEELGILDETLIVHMIGDNGASAEGGLNGSFMTTTAANGGGEYETPEFWTDRLDQIGGPHAYNHYAVGWAHAMCTPYQWTEQVASHYGGTRNGAIVHWPNGIEEPGGLRHQWHHVIDIAPTVLELAGITEPSTVNGVTQMPMHGTSMAYTFNEPDAPERHRTQYFELMGNRAIYDDGWTAVTKHRTPWDLLAKGGDFDEDVWELYDTTTDWTQARDLSAQYPGKLAELQMKFIIEATRFNVFPLDDRSAERMNPELAGRPTLVRGDTLRLYPGTDRLNENVVINTKNTSYSVTAAIGVPESGAEGVIVAQGGRTGGWVFMVDRGRLAFHYNYCGLERFTVTAPGALPTGAHRVHAELRYDGGGTGKGADVVLFVDGGEVARGRVERTHPLYFSFDEGLDVGRDTAMPVYEDYDAPHGTFVGALHWVQIELGKDDHNHLVDPDAQLAAALRHQ
ncbi:arylsulfatase [Nocardiopsis ansamitocini]|uniref:Arylsulfatase n=1 Tax=Nocardiopsis ansamitocini TaxID=1670832 RepID=A0A9W6P9U1_9ACTN|nr:arylsulfatase [Nocardiopsis ansamitocini]GLU50264.1 arylsulfatase [Nocardiopsis ansamitocini]